MYDLEVVPETMHEFAEPECSTIDAAPIEIRSCGPEFLSAHVSAATFPSHGIELRVVLDTRHLHDYFNTNFRKPSTSLLV